MPRKHFTFDNQVLRTMMQEIGAWYNLTVIFEVSLLFGILAKITYRKVGDIKDFL